MTERGQTWQQVEELRDRVAQLRDAAASAETALRLALEDHNPDEGGRRDAAGNLTHGTGDADLYDVADTLALPRVRQAVADVDQAAGRLAIPSTYSQPVDG